MSMTGQQIVDLTRETMDAVSSAEWSDATLTTWCGLAHWQLWANLLNANPYLKMQQITVTLDSSGQFLRSALSTGTTDTKKYFYRIRTLAQLTGTGAPIQLLYRAAKYEDYPIPQPSTALPYVYYPFGDYFQVLPAQAGQQLTATVSYRPPSISQLSALSVAVDFPEGYEPLIAWRAPALGLLKGGAETQAARDIKRMADEMEAQMMMDLGRETRWPIVAQSFDDPAQWGSGAY